MRHFIILFFLFGGLTTFAQVDVSLKFTYNNQAVCNYQITLKVGGGAIGQGTTNDIGEVTFPGIILNVKSVDVSGYKKTNNGEKKFDMNGYITLNEEYFAHIEMETIVKEAASGSGLPESMLAGAWGLTELDCGVSAKNPGSGERVTDSQTSGGEAEAVALPTKEESLALQEQGMRNEIASLERRISTSESEIDELKAAGGNPNDIQIQEYELEELKLKRERKRVGLERNLKMQQGALSEEDRKSFSQREDSFAAREDDIKASRKELEKTMKDEKKGSKEAGGEPGGKMDSTKLKMEIGSVKTQIKLKESNLERAKEKGKSTEEEIAEKEKDLEELRSRLADLELQLNWMN